jgi:hypothetical protein
VILEISQFAIDLEGNLKKGDVLAAKHALNSVLRTGSGVEGFTTVNVPAGC